MLSAGRGAERSRGGPGPHPSIIPLSRNIWLLSISLFIVISFHGGTAWPYDYRHLYNHCPGPEWNVMCRGCCEYDVIRCKCPVQGTPVGYAVPCCRNAINECDPCIFHPGCSIFENCKRCNNGTWGPRDNFFINGQYCAECRPGWSGGDCMKCGGVIRKRQGHLVLESYPNNARCEWTIQVERPFTIELKFMMLSLEFHPSCRYDYVEVRDGDGLDSRVIGRFCGTSRPTALRSSGNSLHVVFVSDGYKNFDGFFATFQETSACSSSPCLHDGTCILDTSYSYHCACLAGYTGKRCENVVGCRRPPVPAHGSTEGLFLHSGARITFRCDAGFRLRGVRSAVCLSDGSWSAAAPECVPAERVCAPPPKPTHGDHFLVYGPNDVLIALQYLCHRPHQLIGASQRTCLPNNTWSGNPPVCAKVNNTLTQAEKGRDEGAEKEKDISETTEKPPESTSGETDTNTGKESSTEDKHTEKKEEKGESEERKTGSEGDVEGRSPDDGLNAVEKTESPKAPEKTDVPGVVASKDKGQEEKERKEEQVNGKKDGGKVGPNDTELRTSEAENAVETLEREKTKNNNNKTVARERENNTAGSPERRITLVNVTMYRSGEEEEKKKERAAAAKKEEKTKEELEREERKEKEREINQSVTEKSCPPLPRLHHGHQQGAPGSGRVEFTCNHSYALSGDASRTCRSDGTWSGEQPVCVRACREPKVSELVKQRVLPPQAPSRKTPLHKLYSSLQTRPLGPTKAPPALPQLPPGFHHLYTHIEYECSSQFYQHAGSARRTCLKTGKWSGRHVSCSPVCGKHPTFDPQRPEAAHWPWLAAIYRRTSKDPLMKVTKAGKQNQNQNQNQDQNQNQNQDQNQNQNQNQNRVSDWQLVCSGALLNQRSVVVAAHCVAELGKTYPLDTARVKVVVGKRYRDDRRETKGLQHLRVASIIVHPNYDPNILDSDLAVLKLLDKARVGESVLPLCLSDVPDEDDLTSARGLVTGWSPLPGLGPDEMARAGLVRLADVVPCEREYARNGVPVSVTDNMLCASQKPDYGPSNICPSDTGGILVLPAAEDGDARRVAHGFSHAGGRSNAPWRLLGLVSFGYDQGECNPELYTVYTRVSNFKDWIESNMK